MPEGSSFYVYDSMGNVVFSSVVSGKSSTILPEDGMIVFIGEATDTFTVSLSK